MAKRNQIDPAGLREAIAAAGNMAALAKALGFKRLNAVQNWIKRGVPLEQCVPIEKATGVPCERLRPDLADHFQHLRSTEPQEVHG